MSDLSSPTLSAEAMEVAEHLDLTRSMQRLNQLRRQMGAGTGQTTSLETREEIREIKENITEEIEQARLDIDAAQAEVSTDRCFYNELLASYLDERDDKVFQSNLWSFRTNGVLWTVCEALGMATVKRPKYAISSGTVGILAGLVPTAFSLVALRQTSGAHFCRVATPNMLSEVFGLPTNARTHIPDSLWKYMQSPLPNDPKGKTRVDRLIDCWLADKHLDLFTDRHSAKQLALFTGSQPHKLTVDVLSQRVIMLDYLSALMNKMNRPLAELMMYVRGKKDLP